MAVAFLTRLRSLTHLRWHTLLTPKQRSHFTRDEAIEIARKYGMETDVAEAMRKGYSPDDALQDWDIYPYKVLSTRR